MSLHSEKFKNLEVELVDLQTILKNSLQNDVLEIKSINHECEKFQETSENFPQMKDAAYVIYSKFMTKKFHESESFVFIDGTGKTVCTLSGRDINLYDMITTCANLIEYEEYSQVEEYK